MKKLLLLACICGSLCAEQPFERVVVLGFDGMDAKLTEAWMEEGKLPNLSALAKQGSYKQIVAPNPPQTPVSWATFATGLDPGETTIFDFLRRQENSYFPEFAMMKEAKAQFLFGDRNGLIFGAGLSVGILLLAAVILVIFRIRTTRAFIIGVVFGALAFYPSYYIFDNWIPNEIPSPKCNRKGQTIWGALTGFNFCSEVFKMPATFPPDEIECGWILSGLGVPDIRGRVGTPSYYTTDPDFFMDENKFSVEIFELPEFEKTFTTAVYGPPNELFPENPKMPKRIDAPLRLTRASEKEILIEVGKQKVILAEGEWSPWVEFEFVFTPLVKIKGTSKFYLGSAHPLKLNLLPINFHPAESPVALSHPKEFASALFKRFGFYKTIGWAIDTWSLDQELITEDGFLAEMYDTVAKETEILLAFLEEKEKPRLYFHYFEFTDRMGHLFWRFIDPYHPRFDANEAAKYGDALLKSYQKVDEIVGETMKRIDDKTLLIVVSDHGFGAWYRAVNYNTWLIREGFMTLKGQTFAPKNLEDLFGGSGEFFEGVDWSATRAYAMGLGNIYINLKGREPQGIVSPGEEYEKVCDEIIQKLQNLVDPESGLKPVYKVYKREEIYRSFDHEFTPDLRVSNRPPYRVSWQSSLGGAPSAIFETNVKKWGADHCSADPSLIPGVLFSNHALTEADARMIDMYPTLMFALGFSSPNVPGKNLLSD